MDAQARKKALFRAKLNAQKKEKRINSPLVRYNEFDQPICRVCDTVLKSESQWDAHQASRKHHQAISDLKANAAGNTRVVTDAKPVTSVESSRTEHDSESQNAVPETSTKVSKVRPSSELPSNFFDNPLEKRPKNDSVKLVDSDSNKNTGSSAKTQPIQELPEKSTNSGGLGAKQTKGVLPEGFYDNKEADLLARGIKPVKPDVKDEYKEFEKLIQDDLQQVDDRFEEEEIDAAEMIEEYESIEQRACREKVDALKRMKMELKASRLAKSKSASEVAQKESKSEELSSDDDSEETFAVDWRAQHL